MIIFLPVCYSASAQPAHTIRGFVYDSLTLQLVCNAGISICGLSNQKFTDKNGGFSFTSPTMECEVDVHCMSYTTKKYVLNSSAVNKIYIGHRSYNLSSVEISVNKPRELIPGISYQVMDYEFLEDNIILLAYERKSIFLPKLLLINSKGDTLSTFNVSKPLRLSRDYDGTVYLLSKTTYYEINIDNNNICLCNPLDKDDFEKINNTIVCHNGNNFYLRQYLNNDQTLNYFSYDEHRDELNCFRTITNVDAISRNRRGAYFDGKEEDIRFQQLIINRAVYAPLIYLNDTFLLFNFLQSKLEKYSPTNDTLTDMAIDLHKNKSFTENIIIDHARSKLYGIFLKSGISQIKEISAHTGDILQTVDIPHFVFIEKIKINNGIIYFLYKAKDLSEYKKLYTMKI